MKKCEICNRKNIDIHHHYCSCCKKLIERAAKKGFSKKVVKKALKDSKRNAKGNLLCYYSGIPLLISKESPRYITFDHSTPKNKNKIVIAAAIINDMKSDMDEKEFRAMIEGLYKYQKAGKKINKRLFVLKHYKR